MSIHHAVAKKAQKLGVTLTAVEGGYSATCGNITNTAASATDALDLTLRAAKADGKAKAPKAPKAKRATAKKGKKRKARKSDDEEDEDDGEGEEGGKSKSIVKAKYKKIYRPTKDTNGDDFAEALHAALFPDGEEFDIAAFNATCRANDIDPKKWVKLNNGQKRMNCGNVLRGKIRRSETVKLGAKVFKGSLKSLPKATAPKD